MNANAKSIPGVSAIARWVFSVAAAGVLLLMVVSSSRALDANAEPAALNKQRADLYLKGTRGPLSDIETDLNRLAKLSEACRIEHGSQACGLPGKPLESDKLEDRYAYYVKGPVEANSKGQGLKINRRNWAGSSAPPSK
jgi:hypothetical protein